MSVEGKVREDKDDVRGRGQRNKEKQERSLQPCLASAWRLDREMRRRLIPHQTGFTRKRFFTSYFNA